METDIQRHEGKVWVAKDTFSFPIPRTEGVHCQSVEAAARCPYPISVEHTSAFFEGLTDERLIDFDAAVEVQKPIPEIRPQGDECSLHLALPYKIEATGDGRYHRDSSVRIRLQHQVIYREADEVSLQLTG